MRDKYSKRVGMGIANVTTAGYLPLHVEDSPSPSLRLCNEIYSDFNGTKFKISRS